MKWSRRDFFKTALAIGAGITKLRAAAAELAIDRLRDSASWNGNDARAYRADAVVVLLGVPIFSRQGVGRAAARIRESVQSERRTLSLCFAGGSDPKRTHGLNYAGWTEEVAVESGAALMEAASFGFVTASSSEESFEQARHRVMDGDGHEHSSFVVVEERHLASRVSVRKTFLSTADAPGSGFGPLTEHVRAQFAEAKPTEREIAVTAPAVPQTFLYSMLGTVRSSERKSTTNYIHDGKRYQLDIEKNGEKNDAADGLTRFTGRIRALEARSNTSFRMWMKEGSDLPERIEWSPRSYLRVSLVFDPTMKEDA